MTRSRVLVLSMLTQRVTFTAIGDGWMTKPIGDFLSRSACFGTGFVSLFLLPSCLGSNAWAVWEASNGDAEVPGLRMDLLLVAGAIFFGGLVGLWLLSKRTPRGTVLIVAAGIFAVSGAVPSFGSREMLPVSGALRVLSIAGLILGIVELLRTKRPTEQPVLAELVVSEDEQETPAGGVEDDQAI
jgi:hypothetical protein